MKRIFQVGFMALALMVAACAELETPNEPQTPENPGTETPETPAPGENDPNVVVFTANVDVKTVIDSEDKAVTWVAGDEVKFLWNGGEAVAAAETSGASTTFKVRLEDGIDEVYAVYPAALGATFVDGELVLDFSNQLEGGEFSKADVSVSRAAKENGVWNTVLNFKNAVCLFKLEITTSDIARIQIKTMADEAIAGRVPVGFDTEGNITLGEPTDGKATVNMTINGPGNYYIPVLAGVEIADGFRINRFDADSEHVGTPFYYMAPFTTERGQIVRLSQFETRCGQYYVTPEGTGNKAGHTWENAIDVETFKEFVTNQDNHFLLKGSTFHFSADEFSFGDDYLYLAYPDHANVAFTLEGTVNGSNRTVFLGRENTNDVAAGVIWVQNNAYLTVKNIKFTGTHGTSNAGVFRLNSGAKELNVINCEFSGNTSAGNGPGICVFTGATVNIEGCRFTENEGWGSVVVAGNASCVINITDTEIVNNVGNSLLVSNGGELKCNGVVFRENETQYQDAGPVLFVQESATVANCSFTDSEFIENGSHVGTTTDRAGIVHTDTDIAEFKFNGCLFDGNFANRAESKNDPCAAIVNSRKAANYYFNACEFKENTSGTGNSDGVFGGKYGMLISIESSATLAMNNCYVHDNYGDRNISELYWISIKNSDAKFILSNSTVLGDPTRYSNGDNKSKDGVIALRGTCNMYLYNSIVCSKYEDGASIVSYDVANVVASLYSKTSKAPDSDTSWNDVEGSGHDYYASASCFSGLDGYMWTGTMTGTNSDKFAPTSTINNAIQSVDQNFYSWLDEIGALGKDMLGNDRGATSWPGCYQN